MLFRAVPHTFVSPVPCLLRILRICTNSTYWTTYNYPETHRMLNEVAKETSASSDEVAKEQVCNKVRLLMKSLKNKCLFYRVVASPGACRLRCMSLHRLRGWGGEVVNEFVRTSTHASAGGRIVTLAYEVCAREAALLCAGQRN